MGPNRSIMIAAVIIVVFIAIIGIALLPGISQSNNVGKRVTYAGKIVCLPHKDTSGPVTLECAYGLQTGDGNYHALRDANDAIYNYSTEDEVTVTGTIVANAENNPYNIVDTVSVESVTLTDDNSSPVIDVTTPSTPPITIQY